MLKQVPVALSMIRNMSEPKGAIISLFKSSAARFVLNELQH